MISRYSPTRELKTPTKPRNITVEQLLAAGCHIGHNKSAVHFAMKPFITGLHGTTHIINLDYTIAHLRRAAFVVREVSFRQGIILFLGTRKGHKPILVEAAERMGGYLLHTKWIPGTITNGNNVLYRGKTIELDTPFRHFADVATREALKKKAETEPLWKGGTMNRFVWDRSDKKWVQTNDSVAEFRDWHGELRSPDNIRDIEPSPGAVVVEKKGETGGAQQSLFIKGNPAAFVGKQEISTLTADQRARLDEKTELGSAEKGADVIDSAISTKSKTESSDNHVALSEHQIVPSKTTSTSSDGQIAPPKNALSENKLKPAAINQVSAPTSPLVEGTRNVISESCKRKFPTFEMKARVRGDLEHWMAWNKFASIVQSISDKTVASLVEPAADSLDGSTLPELSLDPLAYYIPDHKEFWYKRQLQAENDEHNRRQTIAARTGDRTPLEMYEMDKFMATRGWKGYVRGEKITERVENWKKDGLTGYEDVKVFRDGTTMIEKRRFEKNGKPLTQFSDGSYVLNGQVYDREGMRYDSKTNSLSFSDGSLLKFEGHRSSKNLVLKIGEQTFDVTSTVAGSTEKREILEKAADLFEPAQPLSTRDGTAAVAEALEMSPQLVKFEPDQRIKAEEGERDDEIFGGGDPVLMRGSEMFDRERQLSSQRFDRYVRQTNRMRGAREDEAILKKEWYNEDDAPPEPEAFGEHSEVFRSVRTRTFRPDLVICLNPRENKLAMKECANNQIPTIGICDTDSDPRQVTYNIPTNDDSLRSVEFIAGVLSRAGQEGVIHRERYKGQLAFLTDRANALIEDSWLDYDILSWDPASDVPKPVAEDGRTKESVLEKYRQLYRVEKAPEEMIIKIVAQQIVLGQNEVKRLLQDTTDWNMQQHLDHVKSSTEFPGIPVGVLEELARLRLSENRRVWAETREQVAVSQLKYRSPADI